MNMLYYINLLMPYFILIVIGVITPFITRKTIVFGVHVPKDFLNDKEIQGIKTLYIINFLTVSLVFMILVVIRMKNINFAVCGIFIEVIIMFAMYMKAHYEVYALKSKREWSKGKKEVAVVDIDFRKEKIVVSPLWFLLPAAIVILTLAVGIYMYPNIPQRIPVHFNFRGEADSFADKSILSVFSICIVQTVMTALMFFSYKMIELAKQQIDPSDPEISKEKNLRFRRIWSGFVVFASIIINAMLMVTAFIVYGVGGSWQNNMAIFSLLMVLVITIVVIVISIKTGQGGERIKIGHENEKLTSVDRDDDKYWKGGLIYYNPDDPALFVEKRFGVGWTFNFARPTAWLFILAIILIILVTIAIK
ncbi:putative membrane protein [Thermohydrogenium kirishiense]|nr:putative membrane protein [Thermohydrogenium kirishiense]